MLVLAYRMAAVYGSVTMNSTMCLGVFLLMMRIRGIYWAFSSEVIPMLGTVITVGLLGSLRTTYTTLQGLLVAGLYPLTLGLAAFFQAPFIDLDHRGLLE